MITSTQQDLIRASFERVRSNQEYAGQLFYRNLFELAPALNTLFEGTPIATQSGKLMQMLTLIVDHLEPWSTLAITIEQLGARHVAFGVQSDHYAPVGAALINTLRAALGPDFSEDTEEAWTELYSHISLLMEKGAREACIRGPR